MSALDRKKAREAIELWDSETMLMSVEDLLDALEACVVPAPQPTIDRDALLDMLRDALGQHRLDSSVAVGALTDRVLALVRPVEPDPRIARIEALVSATNDWEDVNVVDLRAILRDGAS
jgi:hypothetical protein